VSSVRDASGRICGVRAARPGCSRLGIRHPQTRTVEIAGITDQPDGDWMRQIARNLTDPHDGFLRDLHSVILDRDPLYTATFRDLLRDSGVKPLRLPARSPNLNAFAERFVGSVRSECLARIVPLGGGHLRAAVRAFADHLS
jgi:putative transposase